MPEPADGPTDQVACDCVLHLLEGLGLDDEQTHIVIAFGIHLVAMGIAWEQSRQTHGLPQDMGAARMYLCQQKALTMALADRAMPASPEVAEAMRGRHG